MMLLNFLKIIKSVSEYHVSVKVPAIRKSETSSRKIYIDNKKVGVLEIDLEFIQTLNALAGIPTVLKINDYRIVYFHPVVRKIDLYEHGKLIGHTKKNKDMFDFYIQDEEILPLFVAICLATINSCFL